MKAKTSVRGESAKVLARIAAFLLYYLLLIALGGAIFIAAFFFTKFMLYLIPEISVGRITA